MGSSTGRFIQTYQVKHQWEVMAYDYSRAAVNYLLSLNIRAKQINLNAINAEKTQLFYQQDLKEDLANPTNILLIRVLQYVDKEALSLLLFALLDQAQPGSVFFFAGSLNHQENNSANNKKRKPANAETENYVKSFFAARTNIQFLFTTIVGEANSEHPYDAVDQVLVCRKN